MNERIKQIRKTLKLTQEEFGMRLGVTKYAICKMEKNSYSASARTIASICREFNIDYVWLTTGQGEMFVESDDQIAKLIDTVLAGENELARAIFRGFAQFSAEDWQQLHGLIKKFLGGMNRDEVNALTVSNEK